MLGSNSRRTFLKSLSALAGGVAVNGFGLGNGLVRQGSDIIARSTWTMGTGINISMPESAYDPSVVSRAFANLARVNDALSVFRSDSELMTLNRHADEWLSASDDLLQVSRAALQYGNLTDGALDVTVLPAMRAYGFVGDAQTSKHRHVGIDFTKLRVQGRKVSLAEGYEVDFGGIAKGFGVDEGVREVSNAGVRSALLEAGGDIFALGNRPDGKPWRIGVRNPKDPAELFAKISVSDRAVATSGGYFQTRTVGGNLVSHIIDPATGKSANNLLSATIVAPTAMAADALATAVMVMPRSRSRSLVESLADTDAVLVYSDESLFITPGIARQIEIL